MFTILRKLLATIIKSTITLLPFKFKDLLKTHLPPQIVNYVIHFRNKNHITQTIVPALDPFILENRLLESAPFIQELKKGLDQESCDVVDSFLRKSLIASYADYIKVPDIPKLLEKCTDKANLKILKNSDFIFNDPAFKKLKKKYPRTLVTSCSSGYFHSGVRLFPNEIKQALENKVFLDCGAFYGESSFAFQLYKPTKIYAFEPVKGTNKILNSNIEHYKLQDKIQAVALGISDKQGQVKITNEHFAANSIKTSLQGHYSIKENINYETIEIISIDEYVQKNNITNIGLIKYDIEGAEQGGVIGAKETITKYKPALAISIYHSISDFTDIKPLIDSWNLGYKFKIVATLPADPQINNLLLVEYMLLAYQ